MSVLKDQFVGLHSVNAENYPNEIRKIIFNDEQSKIPEDYIKIIDDKEERLYIRFGAFYCLFTQYRRFEQWHMMYELVDKYIDIFEKNEDYEYFINVIWSQYNKFKLLEEKKPDYYNKAIDYCNKAIECYPKKSKSIGCYSNYADIVTDAISIDGIVPDNDISKALEYLDKVIYYIEAKGLDPYPNYFYRKAKLYAYRKDYKSARENIERAISTSKPDNKDSFIRITNYHNTKLEINTKEAMDVVDKRVQESIDHYEKIKKDMEKQQIKYIEILAFFAAVIGLISQSVDAAKNMKDFGSTAGLIILLFGGLSFAFVFFKVLYLDSVDDKKPYWLMIVSTAIIIVGYLIGKGVIL